VFDISVEGGDLGEFEGCAGIGVSEWGWVGAGMCGELTKRSESVVSGGEGEGEDEGEGEGESERSRGRCGVQVTWEVWCPGTGPVAPGKGGETLRPPLRLRGSPPP
jgi:hypothetical protein